MGRGDAILLLLLNKLVQGRSATASFEDVATLQ